MFHMPSKALGTAGATIAALSLVAAGCGSSSSSGGPKIALLLPENKTARYETQDRPHFQEKLKQICPKCSIIYSNANQDPAKQQQQAEAALTQGAKVLVLDPVDAASADVIVRQATRQTVPVLSYDRLIPNAAIAAYISFDNVRVGKLQAGTLLNKLRTMGQSSPTIVMINGAPTDNNAKLFKQGALSVFNTSRVKIGRQYDTPDWSPDKAQNEMQQAITALGNNGFQGVYAANDGTAGGAIAAMKAAGIQPSTKPTTGQDAELSAIQRILVGEQYMTVYKAVKPEAQDAAVIAYALAQGKQPPTPPINGTTNNGLKSVPSTILTPVAVTKSNIKDTIVKDGFWSVQQICTAQYAAACKANGIS
jgi:D-xylose transport system substrate-binding protein